MRLITAKQAAEILNLRLPRLYELTRQRAIPSVRVGEKSIRFSESALREWIERGGVNQADSVRTETRGVQS
jgi:excisionase family DNA binding protein